MSRLSNPMSFGFNSLKIRHTLQYSRLEVFPSRTVSSIDTNALEMSGGSNDYSEPKVGARAPIVSTPNISLQRGVEPILPSYEDAVSASSLAITEQEDNPFTRAEYRPFLLDPLIACSDWVAQLELKTVMNMVRDEVLNKGEDRLKILVLYGSLRQRSYSRLLSYEAARILFRLGCDVRVYNPSGLPIKDDSEQSHPKVQELRKLSAWSDGHVWVSPEQHGNLTAVFKNQIDWIPLSTGAIRLTQGRTLAISQVNGGSQSFNSVNSLRILGRWMRMFTIPNQSSIPKGYTQFTTDDAEGGSRLMPSSNRDRLVDCMEEFVKYTIIMRRHVGLFADRFSEREEKKAAVKNG
ncbi:hypothetical protein EYR41_007680 [Orbilia oligospora]|uniref:NADPH-dependent FMN reductase-like domain-containing protein n=1 Tax=Orbilia oligospora TaxID=2813651 RepID=A0A7C8KAL5_ORBOL|nr:hypothetical protein TWF751_007059 [Orbilia oligospora]TGJ66018.1 hypothetical protein EYR41_007680 [Orbilia oligospora]